MLGLGTPTRVAREPREDLTPAQERHPAARDMGRWEILLTCGGVQAPPAEVRPLRRGKGGNPAGG